jgi:hypothetical protein
VAKFLVLMWGDEQLRAGPDGHVAATDRPFVDAPVGIGGYYVLEAADLEETTRLASLVPEASAPFSWVEIRPFRSAG